MKKPTTAGNKIAKRTTDPDVTQLVQVLNYFHPVSEGIAQYFKTHTTEYRVRKKKLILKANTICENLYFIKKGY